MNPNCSVCWGSCQGVIGENEVLISTGTRNFKGRAGHPSSKVYLGSAATVTASALQERLRWQVRCDVNYKCHVKHLTESSKFPAKVAKSNRQQVEICLYQEESKLILINCGVVIRYGIESRSKAIFTIRLNEF